MLSTSAKGLQYANIAAQHARDADTVDKMLVTLPTRGSSPSRTTPARFSKSNYPLLEQAYIERRPLSDVDLGVGTTDNGGGLAQETINTGRQWSKANPNMSIVVIPNEANVARLRNLGLAVGKIENVKPKSMATLEYLVYGGRQEDINTVVLRNLKWTEAQANAKVGQAVRKGPCD